jgi:hypothetical protein
MNALIFAIVLCGGLAISVPLIRIMEWPRRGQW